MAVSFVQKIRLALRGWSRRRQEREQEFLRKNLNWAPPPPPPPAAPTPSKRIGAVDREGLQAAYLDGSGQIDYYLDIDTGEVVESRDSSTLDASRFKRVPVRKSEDDDRRAFIETLEPSEIRLSLMKNVASTNFRSVLSSDRKVERAWYNFRNSRATAAIDEWLKTL